MASTEVPWRDREPDLDLGMDHRGFWMGWDPDLELNPQYAHLAEFLPVERVGLTIEHYHGKSGRQCAGAVQFRLGEPLDTVVNPDGQFWVVESMEPLTLSPSIKCLMPDGEGNICEDHGFIRNGRWEL